MELSSSVKSTMPRIIKHERFSDDELKDLVANSLNRTDLCRKMGYTLSGYHKSVKRRIKRLGICTEHFKDFRPINRFSDDEFKELVANSLCYPDLSQKMGYKSSGYSTLALRIKRLKICIKHFTRKRQKPITKLIGRRCRSSLIKVLDQNKQEYICNGCKCDKFEKFHHDNETKWCWQGWPIRLEVDHVDGNVENESASNLQYLCRNCHVQKTHGAIRAKLLANGPLSVRQLEGQKQNNKYREFGLQIPKQTDFSTLDYTNKKSNGRRSTQKYRKWIFESGRDYICENCRCEQYELHEGKWQWNGATIELEVDHIKPRRTNTDDRVENLRFLCPNCHSQTSTYVGGSVGM